MAQRFSQKANEADRATPIAADKQELLAVQADDHVLGSRDALVTLVEYSDFECGACGAYEGLVKQLAADYAEQLQIVVRHFPLMGHKNSINAALAVEAANRQNQYWAMHNLLFDQQAQWGGKQLANAAMFDAYAEEISLDMEQFASDFNDPALRERIDRDLASGRQLGINGTPTFFLNGDRIPNPRSYEDFKSFIEAALSKVNTEETE